VLGAVGELVAAGPARVVVLHDGPDEANVARGVSQPMGEKVARSLLAAVGWTGEVVVGVAASAAVDAGVRDGDVLLVMANGSARRTEKAPGHLDERSFGFDEALGAALRAGDAAALAAVDAGLGEELLAAGLPALHLLGTLLGDVAADVDVRFDGDPFCVQYWVALVTAERAGVPVPA
jgi:hypothetical protein